MSNSTQNTVADVSPPTEISHRGFSASILTDGVPSPLYRIEYDSHKGDLLEELPEKRIRTCWIPSAEGKNFSVAFHNDEREDAEHASCGHIFIDGKDVASAILRPGRVKPAVRDGAKISPTVIKPFTFSKLKLTDDDTIADPNDPRSKDIGTIRVEIKFIRLGKTVPIKPCDPEEIGLMHEKAKKAGIHTTTYGRTRRIDRGRSVSTAPLYPDDDWEHHVVFLFRYRSADILMAEGIMPRPLQANDDVEDGPEDPEDIVMEVQPGEGEPSRKRLFHEDDDDDVHEDKAVERTSATPPKRMRMDDVSSEDDGGVVEDVDDDEPKAEPAASQTVKGEVASQAADDLLAG